LRALFACLCTGTNEPDAKKSYPHEVFTSDGSGGGYAGPISSATDQSVTIPKHADPGYVAGAIAVLSGPVCAIFTQALYSKAKPS
jgi:hypothetical protein